MIDIANELLVRFKKLRDKKGCEIDLEDLDVVINEFVVVIKEYVTENDQHIYHELKGIGDKIQETKQEVAAMLPEGVVTEAALELDTVVKSTEDATNKILDAAEHVQDITSKCSDKDLSPKVSGHINDIFEACSFQDLTGQRIKKVTTTLKYIEKTVGGLLTSFAQSNEGEVWGDTRADAHLMNGPQSEDKTPSQDDIDRLFEST